MGTVPNRTHKIKELIRHYWSRYRRSRRQVAARPDSRFERHTLKWNRTALKCLIADYRSRAAIAKTEQGAES